MQHLTFFAASLKTITLSGNSFIQLRYFVQQEQLPPSQELILSNFWPSPSVTYTRHFEQFLLKRQTASHEHVIFEELYDCM